MAEFDDLPDLQSLKREADAKASAQSSFLTEAACLFHEMAAKVGPVVTPYCEVVEEARTYKRGNWFWGYRTVKTPGRFGWELGFADPLSDYPRRTVLLADGSVYPSIAAGVEALLEAAPGRPISYRALLNEPSLWSTNARAVFVEQLRQRYFHWCGRSAS
jgi:hypothetical protein